MEQAGKRLSGRKVTIGFGLVVATIVAFVIGFWFYGRAPSGRILSFTPVDGRRVLLVREGYSQKHLVHLTNRDIERGQLWAVPFHGIPRGASAVVVGPRVLMFVENEIGGLEIDAHELASGAFAFRALDLRVPRGVTPEVTMIAVGSRVVAAYRLADTHVVVVDATSGEVVAEHLLEGVTTLPSLRLEGSSVVVRPRGGVELLVDPVAGTFLVAQPALVHPQTATVRPTLPFRLEVTLAGRVAPIEVPVLTDSVYWVVTGTSVAAIGASDGRVIGSNGPASFVTRPLAAR